MTTETLHATPVSTTSASEIRSVRLGEPFAWLRAGWRDFAAAPGVSLLYGAIFALACLGLVALTRQLPWFTIAFLTGLLAMGPFLAAGLYTAARQLAAGEPVSVRAGLGLLRSRSTNLALFAVFLALIMAAWVRLSALLFAVKFGTFSPSIEGYLGVLGGSGGDPIVWAYFVSIGLALAGVVFVTSAVAIPLILDRDAGPITAMQTSARAVARNWPAMLVWAGLIVVLTTVGIASFFVAMLMIFPVLGYATWHSYRRLVG
jgi:uncharacterized membrane protein